MHFFMASFCRSAVLAAHALGEGLFLVDFMAALLK